MDIEIKRNEMKVMSRGKIVKSLELTPESFKEYMGELSRDRIEMIRTASRLLKSNSWKFKDVNF